MCSLLVLVQGQVVQTLVLVLVHILVDTAQCKVLLLTQVLGRTYTLTQQVET
jgi:hypothetical protein